MSALPPERTTLTSPFTHTVIDFAGPFNIKSYIGRGCRITKGYVLVFVCFATRAIHLEATNDISTECFLAAFFRCLSRRGCSSHLYSDNGTAFVGAANLLNKNRTRSEDLKRQIATKNDFQLVDWHFIPPRVSLMKNCRLLARIEACLNSRRLSSMTANRKDGGRMSRCLCVEFK